MNSSYFMWHSFDRLGSSHAFPIVGKATADVRSERRQRSPEGCGSRRGSVRKRGQGGDRVSAAYAGAGGAGSTAEGAVSRWSGGAVSGPARADADTTAA